MLILLILLLILLRLVLRNFGGDFTFALILLAMFFVRLNIKRSTTNPIDDFSDIEKYCQPRKRHINLTYNPDYDYFNEEDKHYTKLEYKVLDLKRAKLQHDFYFQRLWTYTMLVLFFFVCALCVPYALVYASKEYYQPEELSRPEHKIMRFIVAVAVIAVAAHQI